MYRVMQMARDKDLELDPQREWEKERAGGGGAEKGKAARGWAVRSFWQGERIWSEAAPRSLKISRILG